MAQAGAVDAFAGTITGTGSFIVNGSSGLIQTLSGTSDYSGATKVEQGTLQAGAANSFSASSAHTISSRGDPGSQQLRRDHRLARRRRRCDPGHRHTDHRRRQQQQHDLLRRRLGQRRAHQGRQRHDHPFGHEPLRRRHGGHRRHPQHLSRCQSGQWRDGGAGERHHPRLHRRRHLQPFDHGGGRSDLRCRHRADGDPERLIADGATPGEVEKTGDGTLVLGAAESYTGGTTVTAGTLSSDAGGSLASPAR